MKSNEAPEKIYIQPNAHDGWFGNNPHSKNFVEYTRTDAFIEKACEYLSYHLNTSKIDVNYKFNFIENFRNYMKGE